MSEVLLRIALQAGYGKQTVLEDIHFEIARGEKIGLAGTSGGGKSTLILALMGLLRWRHGWVKGEVLFRGKNLLAMKERESRQIRGSQIALVPQSPLNALNGALSLRAHFEEAWKAHESGPASRMTDRLGALLDQVHLSGSKEFLARRPGEISVGQAQRILIALALLHRPALVIADEPTSALDPGTQIEILKLLEEANRLDGTALLYVSHDLLSILQLCDRIAVLDAGRIVESLPVPGIESTACCEATIKLLRTLPAPADVIHRYALENRGVPCAAGRLDR